MHFETIDWTIMIVFFLVSLGIGVAVSKRAGKDYNSFFLGGRNMPWWLLGISMVATTFSTDTPNLVADIVRSNGVLGNWVWWAFLLTGMLTVFLYAKLWRRSGVLTDVEFYEIRYSGPIAVFLRGFRAVYLGILFNIFVMATVTLAAIKIGGVMMGWTPVQTVVIAATITMIYSALGGLRGVLLTDLIQFTLAMTGSVWAAIYIVGLPEVGGLTNLLQHENVSGSLNFWPSFDALTWQDMIPVFIMPLAVQWWASYYPGAEPGGGGYIVQRMLSAKGEKHAVGATLLFNGMHYAVRPWPWILVALASLIVFPDIESIARQFPHMDAQIVRNDMAYPAMLTYLPAGLLGLVVTSLAAAYMSTMSTQVNWGSSIIVNDVYCRFFNRDASEGQQVWAGRISTVLLMVVACVFALFMQNALQMFEILILIGAGTGLVFILRWFWWRINAAVELTAMIVSFVVAIAFQFVGLDWPEWQKLLLNVVVTTATWLVVAYTSKPTDRKVLYSFYNHIKPGGPGWEYIYREAKAEGVEIEHGAGTDLPVGILCTVLGTVGIWSALFATGFFIYGRTSMGIIFGALSAVSLWGIKYMWPRLSFE